MTADPDDRRAPLLRGPALWGLVGLLILAAAGSAWWLLRGGAGERSGGPRLPSGQFGGAVTALAVTPQGDEAWLGAGPRLVGVALADPANARLMGQSEPLRQAIRAVALDGRGQVYAALGVGGLAVFTVADPARPRQVGSLATDWSVNDLALSADGTTAYLAEGTRGLRVVDLSRPDAPREVGRLDTPGDALAVALGAGGSLAYVADWGTGVRVVDLSDPAAPREAGWVDTPGEAADVAVAGDLLVVADRLQGLRVVSLADAGAPRELGSLALPAGASAERVAIQADGKRAYLAAQSGGLLSVDLSDPATPRLLGRSADVKVAMDVALVEPRGDHPDDAPGPRVFAADVGTNVAPARDSRADLWSRMHLWGVEGAPKVAAGLAGLLIAEPAPDGLRTLGLYLSPSLIEGVAVDEAAGVMYLADGHAGLIVLDLADPDRPRLIGSVDTAGIAHDLRLTADRVYLADGPAGVVELDRSDPRDPKPLRVMDTPGEAMGLAERDGLLYVADGPAGLLVLDLATGQSVGAVDSPGYGWDVALGGSHAYLSDRKGGMRIYTLADPAQPLELGQRLEGSAEVLDVLVDGDRLWVSAGASGVQLMDAADPANPKPLGSLIVDDRAIGILVDGSRAYVASGSAGVRELDTSSPAALRELGAWEMPGAAERMARLGDRLYIAAEMGGLQVVKLR